MSHLYQHHPDDSWAERQAAAERVFASAQQLVAGGLVEARAYALGFYEFHRNDKWFRAGEVERERLVASLAKNALACAHNIVLDGRAHYVMTPEGCKARYGVYCTLHEDATAGPVGYMLWHSV